jgi:hypothetical protein
MRTNDALPTDTPRSLTLSDPSLRLRMTGLACTVLANWVSLFVFERSVIGTANWLTG